MTWLIPIAALVLILLLIAALWWATRQQSPQSRVELDWTERQ